MILSVWARATLMQTRNYALLFIQLTHLTVTDKKQKSVRSYLKCTYMAHKYYLWKGYDKYWKVYL